MSHVSSVNFKTGNVTSADVFGSVPTGANSRMGTAVLSAGAATVNTNVVTANSVILLTSQANAVTGALRVSAKTPGTSFAITSSVGADAGSVGWLILEPAA